METNVNLADVNSLLNLSGPVMLALRRYGCTIAIIVHDVYFEIYQTEDRWYADRLVPVDGLPEFYMAESFEELRSTIYHNEPNDETGDTYVGEWKE